MCSRHRSGESVCVCVCVDECNTMAKGIIKESGLMHKLNSMGKWSVRKVWEKGGGAGTR